MLEGPAIRVDGLFNSTDDDSSFSIYCILSGACWLLSDCRADGNRRKADVAIRCKPECEPNDGFLELVTKSQNGCGIAANGELLRDFKEELTPHSASATAKHFNGAIEK